MTATRIDLIASTMISSMFAPHELPVSDEIRRNYLRVAGLVDTALRAAPPSPEPVAWIVTWPDGEISFTRRPTEYVACKLTPLAPVSQPEGPQAREVTKAFAERVIADHMMVELRNYSGQSAATFESTVMGAIMRAALHPHPPSPHAREQFAENANWSAMRKALQSLEYWCTDERTKLGAVDGYDYRSGQEYGIRQVEIEIFKRLAALPSSPAPRISQDSVTEQLPEREPVGGAGEATQRCAECNCANPPTGCTWIKSDGAGEAISLSAAVNAGIDAISQADHEVIWLSPRCEAETYEGRTWSTSPQDCPDCELKSVKYVLAADLAEVLKNVRISIAEILSRISGSIPIELHRACHALTHMTKGAGNE